MSEEIKPGDRVRFRDQSGIWTVKAVSQNGEIAFIGRKATGKQQYRTELTSDLEKINRKGAKS